MKVLILTFLCLFISFMGLQVSDAHAEPKSYPLMCRGGGIMKGTFWPKGIKFQFTGGSQGAGARPPQPGECTWLDRGFRPGEPREIVWHDRDLDGLMVNFDAQGRLNSLEIKGKASDKYKYLFNSIRNGSVFQIHAYNATCRGSKCPFLSTTKVGP